MIPTLIDIDSDTRHAIGDDAPPSLAYEIAGGTVQGRDHRARGRNNQDAYTWGAADGAMVAVVADGCGSAQRSEVGAGVGARLLRESCLRHAASLRCGSADEWLEERRQDVLASLRSLVEAMGGEDEFVDVVHSHFLFTLQAAVLTPSCSLVAGIGDGYLRIDGRTIDVEAPGNAPPYLGYALLPPERVEMDPARFRFAIHAEGPGGAFDRLLLGTDGVRDLASVSSLDPFWDDDRFYRNPHVLTRELTRLAADTHRIDWRERRKETRPGALPDDTTLIVLRRRSSIDGIEAIEGIEGDDR
jgi:Protein phosphatase 2C